MRKSLLLVFLLALACLPHHATAAEPANAVAAHQAAAPAAATPAPASHGATIIPGSPLAVLTGASAPAPPPPTTQQIDTASPFGSGNLGLSLTSVIGAGTAHTLRAFIAAVRQSTELTPVAKWAGSLFSLPARRGHAIDISLGLLIAVLPALVAEAVVRFGLTRPRAALAARATRLAPLGTPTLPDEALADAEAGATEPRRRRFNTVLWARRIARGLLYLTLSLLPVLTFALVSGVILGTGVVATRQARLGIVVVCNAYLFGRLSVEILRFFLAPNVPALRLIPTPEGRAHRIVALTGITLFTAAFGYAAISIFQILGLPRDGMSVLGRLLALVVHLEVALMIWRSRHIVARWIVGKPRTKTVFTEMRRRFSYIWHYFALFYVVALWVAWVGGVQHIFGLLLRIVLVTTGTMVIGRLTWVGSGRLLEHLFPQNEDTSRRADFYARARAYNPLIHGIIRIIIIGVGLVIILEGWGLHILPWLTRDKFSRGLISAFFSILLTIGIALALWETIIALLNARIDQLANSDRTRHAARLRTLMPMLQAAIGVPIALVAGLVSLSKIGVNAAPLLAGASVLGIAIGFGSQKLVQDIITGLFLLLEDSVQVGDVVNLASMTGTVERLSIRTIRLRGGDGSINIIPFSAVTTVTNMTRDFSYAQISIQVGYEEDLTRVYSILEDIAKTMRAETRWSAMIRDDLQLFGLDQFGASALVITGQIRTGPGQHWAVRREYNARVKQRFEAEHIDMPYAYLPPGPSAKPDEPALDEAKPPSELPVEGKR